MWTTNIYIDHTDEKVYIKKLVLSVLSQQKLMQKRQEKPCSQVLFSVTRVTEYPLSKQS